MNLKTDPISIAKDVMAAAAMIGPLLAQYVVNPTGTVVIRVVEQIVPVINGLLDFISAVESKNPDLWSQVSAESKAEIASWRKFRESQQPPAG